MKKGNEKDSDLLKHILIGVVVLSLTACCILGFLTLSNNIKENNLTQTSNQAQQTLEIKEEIKELKSEIAQNKKMIEDLIKEKNNQTLEALNREDQQELSRSLNIESEQRNETNIPQQGKINQKVEEGIKEYNMGTR